MRKAIFTVFAVFAICTFTKAQSPAFYKGNEIYVPLTGASRVVADSVWDDPDAWRLVDQKIPLGFTFKAFGKKIDTFLWEQGGIYYRDKDTVVYIGLDDLDMCDYGYGTKNPKSPILMKREGNAGNYIMKLEWQRFGFWDDWSDNGTCKDSGNMQVWIYQTGKIDLRFGKSQIASFNSLFPDGMRVLCAKYDKDGRTSGMKLDGPAANPSIHSFDDTATRTVKGWPTNTALYVFAFDGSTTGLHMTTEFHAYYAGGRVFLDKGQANAETYGVFNLAGQYMMPVQFSNASADVSSLPQGMYLLKSKTSGNYLRFVKE